MPDETTNTNPHQNSDVPNLGGQVSPDQTPVAPTSAEGYGEAKQESSAPATTDTIPVEVPSEPLPAPTDEVKPVEVTNTAPATDSAPAYAESFGEAKPAEVTDTPP